MSAPPPAATTSPAVPPPPAGSSPVGLQPPVLAPPALTVPPATWIATVAKGPGTVYIVALSTLGVAAAISVTALVLIRRSD